MLQALFSVANGTAVNVALKAFAAEQLADCELVLPTEFHLLPNVADGADNSTSSVVTVQEHPLTTEAIVKYPILCVISNALHFYFNKEHHVASGSVNAAPPELAPVDDSEDMQLESDEKAQTSILNAIQLAQPIGDGMDVNTPLMLPVRAFFLPTDFSFLQSVRETAGLNK